MLSQNLPEAKRIDLIGSEGITLTVGKYNSYTPPIEIIPTPEETTPEEDNTTTKDEDNTTTPPETPDTETPSDTPDSNEENNEE